MCSSSSKPAALALKAAMANPDFKTHLERINETLKNFEAAEASADVPNEEEEQQQPAGVPPRAHAQPMQQTKVQRAHPPRMTIQPKPM